jgi:tetratricopeptide (TPR) repeat protein
MGNYHPLTMQTLAWDYQRFGVESARGYHQMNLIYHILATIAVFLFIRSLTRGKLLVAFFTAAVFALHPMHVESVAWIASRKDQVYALFFFLSLWAYTEYVIRDAKSYALLIAAFIGFVLSVLGKAMAAPLPLVLVLIDYYMNRKFTLKTGLEKIPFLLVSLYFGRLAITAQESSSAITENFDFGQKIFFAGSSFLMYIAKFFAPFELAALYPYPRVTAGDSLPPRFYLFTLISLALVGAVIWSMKKTRLWSFGLGFYALMVALVLQILAVGQAIMADRYTYVPYVGIAFIIGMLVHRGINNAKLKKYKSFMVGLAGFFLIGLMLGTVNRVKVWKDTPSLFTDLIEKQPTVGLAYNNRGKYYAAKENDLVRGLADLNKGIEMEPTYPNCYVNRGNIYGMQQKVNEALQDYNTAIRLKPDYFDAYVNRAIAHSVLGNFEKALQDYTTAINLNPDNFQLYFNRGYGYMEQGQYQNALNDFNKSLQLNPNFGRTYLYRSQLHAQMGNFQAARKDVRTAQQLGESVPSEYLQQINAN